MESYLTELLAHLVGVVLARTLLVHRVVVVEALFVDVLL